jgi:hypothetical protein
MVFIEGRMENSVRLVKRRRRRVSASVCRRCDVRVRWHQIRCPYCDRVPRAFWIAVTAISIAVVIVFAVDLMIE